jgi:dipeptidyl aminopeptidase/acylaminoacyl peptidase
LRDGSERVVLRNATNASWIASGHLLFVRGVMLMAQRFDLERGEVTGDAVTVAPSVGVLRAESMNALYSASRDGRILALQPSLSQDVRLVHLTLDGDVIAELAGPARIWFPAVSPDARRLAFDVAPAAGDADIWTMDMTRRVIMRLTSEPANDKTPVWSPDGKWIVYSSDLGLFRIASGGGTRELLVRTPFSIVPTDWSRDGELIIFTEYDEPGGPNIKALRMSDRKVVPIISTQFREHWGRLSPDGQWIAYNSNESGQSEVYIQRFKDGAFKTRISRAAASQPGWRAESAFTTRHGAWSTSSWATAFRYRSLRLSTAVLWK